MIVPRHYENLKVLHENTLPNRSYYIPASKPMYDLVENRISSDRFQLLNDTWQFRYYDSIYDLKEEFFAADYDASGFDTIPVPGMWQNAGYDLHQYTNLRYPFPFDPPYVPQDNPCGAYVYDFDYSVCQDAPKAYLVFEGVDSCFYVWVNGKYVGYSQVSHSTSEFDVTDKLTEGKNRIAVLVLKWCDGSYMEDQDKFRMSGIFRDVFLLKRPKQTLFDYFVKTSYTKELAKVNVELTYFDKAVETQISIYDKDGTLIQKTQVEDAECADLEIPDPTLWSAENPYLYTIVFETEKEVIVDRVGIRKIEVIDRVMYFNDQPIVFRGVNRHDSDPVTGFVISIDQMKKDMEIMKLHNFNAIRTSHYPNAPYFYQLCDQYGFMVIDEADNESHGPAAIYYADSTEQYAQKRWNETIADNPDWTQATLDRTQRMMYRDKNRPCVVIWSMGNECAYGVTFEDTLKWAKSYDDTRLMQFESARYVSGNRKYDYSNLDFHARMYPPFNEIEDYMNSNPDKPYLLIEYSHAMGNGPGDFEDHFQLFHKYPLMCGGFVWEWCDHAIDHGKAEDGRTIYYYGGDHGEDVHDNNFCMDGLVYPDRRPHTGIMEYKNVHRPVRVVGYDGKEKVITFHNYLDFTDVKDYIRMEYEVNCDGKVIQSGEISPVSVLPHQDGTAPLAVNIPEKGKTYLKVTYYSTKDVPLVPAGHILGFDEVALENADSRNQDVVQICSGFAASEKAVTVEETDTCICLKGDDFEYYLDKRTGLFTSLIKDGKELLTRPMEVNIWRAPTDNDMYIRKEWQRAGFDRTCVRAYYADTEVQKQSVQIQSKMSLAANAVQKMLDMDTTWTVDGNGTIRMKMDVSRYPEFPMLPRFGLRLFLNKEMEDVTYYGMGPMESYQDKRWASSHSLYSAKAADMHEDYIKPQENGSHFDCQLVEVSGAGQKLLAVAENAFSFNASVYTQEELTAKMHNYELQASDETILCLDYAQTGIGSNSCGQALLSKYRFEEKEFTFALDLILTK